MIPEIKIVGIPDNAFSEAVETLQSCIRTKLPYEGFIYPYFSPGGYYGDGWWQLDLSLSLNGYKWIDLPFCENNLKNFVLTQENDGRIWLWAGNLVPHVPEASKYVSSLPKLFDAAYNVLCLSGNRELLQPVYDMLKKYLNWWYTERLDSMTGLITASFEETFVPYIGKAGERAVMDTNAEIVVACDILYRLAEYLGKNEDCALFIKRKAELIRAINRYLWNEEKGCYYAYFVKEKKMENMLMANTFNGMRKKICGEDRKKRLLSLLEDDRYFNFNTYPLTSVAKNDPAFQVVEGEYIGNPCWQGNVWTLINTEVVKSLIDSDELKMAARLAYKTISEFSCNYSEFLNPITGKGNGVEKYAWTASQYIELIVDVLFGIHFNRFENKLIIKPLFGLLGIKGDYSIKSLKLTENCVLDLEILCDNTCEINYELHGEADFTVEVIEVNN